MREVLAILSGRDASLAELIRRYGSPVFRRQPTSTRFTALVRAIVYQQLAGAAAAAIFGRLVSLLGGEVTPQAITALDIQALMTSGLSRAKARAVSDLSQKVTQNVVRLDQMGRFTDDDVVRQLTQVWGIGRWTAEMFLIFTLARLDVWPLDDYGVRMGFAKGWGLPTTPSAPELYTLGEPFRPYRSVVAWYCWRAAEDGPRSTRPPRPPRQAASKRTGSSVGDRKTSPRM